MKRVNRHIPKEKNVEKLELYVQKLKKKDGNKRGNKG